MPTIDMIINAVATLFVTIDPLGLAPLFLALTAGMNRSERNQVALRASAIGFAILVLFALAGTLILSLFGITLGAFRVAGGLLLFWIAFEMIFEKRQQRHENTAKRAVTKDEIHNVSVFPLAIPLIAGPGAISAIVLLSSGDFSDPVPRGVLIGIVAGFMLVTWFVFFLSEKIDKFLGETGRSVITRLLGVLLAALSVQFVADGVKALMGTQS